MDSDEDDQCEDDQFEDEDLLPMDFVMKQMQWVLPESAIISESAAKAMQLCLSDFVDFTSNEVIEYCGFDDNTTITGKDLIKTLDSLGFEEYAKPLRVYWKKVRKVLSTATKEVRDLKEMLGGGGTGNKGRGNSTEVAVEESEKKGREGTGENGNGNSTTVIVEEGEKKGSGETEEAEENCAFMQGVVDGVRDEASGVQQKE